MRQLLLSFTPSHPGHLAPSPMSVLCLPKVPVASPTQALQVCWARPVPFLRAELHFLYLGAIRHVQLCRTEPWLLPGLFARRLVASPIARGCREWSAWAGWADLCRATCRPSSCKKLPRLFASRRQLQLGPAPGMWAANAAAEAPHKSSSRWLSGTKAAGNGLPGMGGAPWSLLLQKLLQLYALWI